MSTTVRAVYVGGVLRPLQPLALADGETVELTLVASGAAPPGSEEEVVRRIQECKSYSEWLEIMKSLPAESDYDIVQALDDNRRWSGERPLLADENKAP